MSADARAEVRAPVLGVPVRLTSDSAQLLAAFEASFAGWRALDGRGDLIAGGRIEASIDVGPHAPPPHPTAPGGASIEHRPVGPTLHVSGAGVEVTSDAALGRIQGRVSPALLDDPARVRRDVLEAAVLWAIAHGPHDRQPLHAAAVVGDRSALLLTGPSGAGKSTLSYAAARSGLRVLGDEGVFIQRDPLCVWAQPGALRLTRASSRFFPEIAHLPIRLDERGREKVEVSPGDAAATAFVPVVGPVGLCVLERSPDAAPRWVRLSAAQLEDLLEGQLEQGFHLFGGRMRDVAAALAERGAWRLWVGEKPVEWVEALEHLLEDVAAG